ncbi:MAG: WG repeat-containing protein [Firmicutes bacterium]|nr:WG repeat-containing protein [Bacillota bacterium]
MKKTSRILLSAAFLILLAISWIVALNTKPLAKKQWELLEQAAALMEDKIYIRALPLLEEASQYNSTYTLSAENLLKSAYLALIDQGGYQRKYTGLLNKQMNRTDATPAVFLEAAHYYLDSAQLSNALNVLKTGIDKTASTELLDLYEKNRYAIEISRSVYDNALAIYGATLQVQKNGLWGIAKSDGSLLIPCEYEKISTYSVDRAIVKQGEEIFAVDSHNNRIAKLQGTAEDFGNYAHNRLPLLTAKGWLRSTGEFELGNMTFQALGMYQNAYAAAQENDKWGIIGIGNEWLITPQYEELIFDELGNCYAQNALFFKKQGAVYLLAANEVLPAVYENARPFADGYAAVKRNGKWGFVDNKGVIQIDFFFEDALSFGQHLAAVKWNGLWGYMSVSGNIVIEPVFKEAKSFSNGSAPVLTERGWQLITLLEYKKGVDL